MECADVGFVPPPEAPVFEPTWEEFKNPMDYIEKIRPIGEKYGICKIRPPPSWAPPFAIDADTFKFTPRIQKLNELEVLSRVKMNYIEQLTRFWKLQGIDVKVPVIERRVLDLFRLRKTINEEGGLDQVIQNNKWPKVVQRLGHSSVKGIIPTLKNHYERFILPYDKFVRSSMKNSSRCNDNEICFAEDCLDFDDKMQIGETSTTDAKPHKVQKARRMGSEVRAKEATTLHCYSSGTKIKITTSPTKGKNGSSPAGKMKTEVPNYSYVSAADTYFCEVCSGGDDEEHMLLCDGCDDAYHMQCLVPPLIEVPPGDWMCPRCLAKECRKPLEVYGFEQSEQEYTLESFGNMADKFKSEHFSASPQQVPYAAVEKEFWRLVECTEEDVTVEYGADIHAGDHGSGFPTDKTRDRFSGDEDYIVSGWNLNNLPVLGSSLLQFVSVNISGMKVPWVYVGMCFSSFSWHTEDHWSYSINYLHRGESKTWYGVPGAKAELLEGCMKNLVPELFIQSPDLLHQLTTLMNPNTLMAHGVPIYRTDQEAGNFVITFPRAYHAGFNQGFNVAEAVNFCPPDWIPMGRACIEHYRSLKRQCVFSHDELLCQIAENAEKVDVTLARHVFDDLTTALEGERKFRARLAEQGILSSERKIFEQQEDDERQCAVCNTTCFLSALKCSCKPDSLMCIDHSERLCNCEPSSRCLVFRYTLDEMSDLLTTLKARAEQLEDWKRRARAALDAKTDKRKDVTWFRELISEVQFKNLPKTLELDSLKEAVSAADVCIEIGRMLLDRKVRSSQRSSADMRNVPRLTVAELENFCRKVDMLACTFKEALMFQDLLISINKFKNAAADILKSAAIPSVATLEFQIDWGTRLEVELPELVNLNEMLLMARWMNDYEKAVGTNRGITLPELRKLKTTGASMRPHPSFQSSLARVMNMLALSENLEQRAASCLSPGCRSSIVSLENIIREAETLKVALPHIPDVKSLLKTASDWNRRVQDVLSANDRFLAPDEVELLRKEGEKIPVELELLEILQKKLLAIDAWKEKLNRVFADASYRELLQVLVREIDADESQIVVSQVPDASGNVQPKNLVVARLAKLRAQMLEALRKNVASSCSQLIEQAQNCGACLNNDHDGVNHIQQCVACAGKYFGCKNRSLMMHGSCQKSYVCPTCKQLKRVTIEDVQQLVSSYQQLGFQLTEGRAVAYIAAEVSRWQNMARLTLSTDEMTSALKLLNFPLTNVRIWGKECGGEKSTSGRGARNERSSNEWSESTSHPIDLSISSSRKVASENLRSPSVDDLVQRIKTDSVMRERLLDMDLSEEAQASLNDLLLESHVLNIATEEAQVISFLLFSAWQRALIVEARRKEEELRRKREEEERRRREEEERKRREEEERKRREEEERRRREEEERRRHEEEVRRKREEEESRRREELRRKREEEMRRQQEEELRRKREEEELRRKREAEEMRRKEEEELRRKKEEELRRKRAEEEQSRMQQEMRLKREEEARKQKEKKMMKKTTGISEKAQTEMKPETPQKQTKSTPMKRKRLQELQKEFDEEEEENRKHSFDTDKTSLKTIQGQKSQLLDSSQKKSDKKKVGKNEENHLDEMILEKKGKKRKSDADVLEEQDNKMKKTEIAKAKCKTKGQKKCKDNPKRKRRKQSTSDSDNFDDDDEEEEEEDDEDGGGGGDGYGDCAAVRCLKPSGRNLNWVQCDRCDQWYHLICQGLKPQQVSGSKPYFCPLCPEKPEKPEKQIKTDSSPSDSSVDLGLSFESPKSRNSSGKKQSAKERNGGHAQKSPKASPQKTDVEKPTPSNGGEKSPPAKKTPAKKLLLSPSNVQGLQGGATQESATPGRAKIPADSDPPKSAGDSKKKKSKKTDKLGSKKTPSPEPAVKSPGALSSWSQKVTSLTPVVDNDSRQDEGSNTTTPKSCFSQYLYAPWLSNNSSFR